MSSRWSTDHDDVLETLDAVDLDSSCGTIVFSTSLTHRSTSAEDRVHLVEEHDDRRAFACLLTCALEHEPDVPLGLADVLVEQLRALDVEEVGPALALARLGNLLRERVRDRLGDERLPQPGGP